MHTLTAGDLYTLGVSIDVMDTINTDERPRTMSLRERICLPATAEILTQLYDVNVQDDQYARCHPYFLLCSQ